MPASALVNDVQPMWGVVRSELQDRVLDAALACFSRWGLAKTTLDDVAREAGLSRATVYRAVPGGKFGLVREVAQREIVLAVVGIDASLAGAESLDDLLVSGLVGIARSVAGHELVQYLLAHEPEVVLPFIAFDRLGPALDLAVALVGPHLERFLTAEVAAEVAEWMTRLFVSFTFVPGVVDLTNEADVRRYLRAFVLPGIQLAARQSVEPTVALATPLTNHQPQGE